MNDQLPEGMAELTDQDIADLEALAHSEAPNFHTILEVWREVLKPIDEERTKRPTPQWANTMIQSYPELKYKDCTLLRDRYYDKLQALRDILLEVIASDEECLNYSEPTEDAAENARHYRDLLRMWQMKFTSWELVWDCTDPHAAVELASLGEVHKTVFAQTGMLGFLDNIKFEFTEADQAELQAALVEQREAAQ